MLKCYAILCKKPSSLKCSRQETMILLSQAGSDRVVSTFDQQQTGSLNFYFIHKISPALFSSFLPIHGKNQENNAKETIRFA
jgi:hypothetical protein